MMYSEGSGAEMEKPRDSSEPEPSEWNPMEETFSSFLNMPTINPNDVMGIQEGRNCTRENLCKFYDGFSEGCWKGSNCFQQHIKHSGPIICQKSSKMGARVDKEKITHEIKLRLKEVAPPGSIFRAIVTYVKSPEDFYIIPATDFGCACYQPVNPSGKQHVASGEPHQAGFEYFKNISQELIEAMQSPKYQKSRNDFAGFETVAVKLRSSSRKDFWTRAVVLESVVLEGGWDLMMKPPDVSVYLFDIGMRLTVSAREVSPLPKCFSKIAPFAGKCTLHGIKPIGGEWTDEGIQFFKDLVNCPKEVSDLLDYPEENQVTVHVKRSIMEKNQTVQRVPYSVVLYRSRQCGGDKKSLCVSEELVNAGFAEYAVKTDRMGLSYSTYDILYGSD